MAIVMLKLRHVSKKAYWALFGFLVFLLLVDKINFSVVARTTIGQAWLISSFGSVTVMGYGLPLLFIVLLTTMESTKIVTENVMSRMQGRYQLFSTTIITVVVCAVFIGGANLVVGWLLALPDLANGWHWSPALVRTFSQYWHIKPNVRIPPAVQPLLFSVLLSLYLLALGLLWEILRQVFKDLRVCFTLSVLVVMLMAFSFKVASYSPLLGYLPVRYYVYYMGNAIPFAAARYLIYWALIIGSLVVVLFGLHMGKKQVLYD
jgi:hypothetical protein